MQNLCSVSTPYFVFSYWHHTHIQRIAHCPTSFQVSNCLHSIICRTPAISHQVSAPFTGQSLPQHQIPTISTFMKHSKHSTATTTSTSTACTVSTAPQPPQPLKHTDIHRTPSIHCSLHSLRYTLISNESDDVHHKVGANYSIYAKKCI